MEQILNLQNTGEKDYHFEESIKTLRTNLQFVEAAENNHVYKFICPMKEK